LEDRIAKDTLREGAHNGVLEILTRKPVIAEEEETDRNPRSRSAKLRAAQKQAPGIREQGTEKYERRQGIKRSRG
jgi:16S rRNA (cytosine1402-N4)-methyltransferase